jgi:hypothetical protein
VCFIVFSNRVFVFMASCFLCDFVFYAARSPLLVSLLFRPARVHSESSGFISNQGDVIARGGIRGGSSASGGAIARADLINNDDSHDDDDHDDHDFHDRDRDDRDDAPSKVTATRTSAVAGNPVLLRFALSLVNRVEDPLVRELTMGMMRVCPDAVAA